MYEYAELDNTKRDDLFSHGLQSHDKVERNEY